MYRILVACAFLCATPLVAQWTVSPYAGGSVPLIAPTSLEAVTVPLALDPAGRVVIAAAMDKVIWRIRAGGAERIAGTGVSGFGGDGGPATAALLDGPRELNGTRQATSTSWMRITTGYGASIRRGSSQRLRARESCGLREWTGKVRRHRDPLSAR